VVRRVLAGLARARQTGTHLGRKFTEDTKDGSRKIKTVLAMRAKGFGYRKIAREVGLGVGTVMRLTATTEQISGPFDGASVAAT
jgi:DNA invertase Pin-like site-specific DNA recombinase